ncbi:hypothetical protein V6O07_05585, partial [Arthrospira platensis SPKY2]
MIRNKLLSKIFFGSELEKLGFGTVSTAYALMNLVPEFSNFDNHNFENVCEIVKGFFKNRLKGSFGGPITAGDAFFICAYLAAIKPSSVIEIGVCSGVSSAFILYAGHKLGLVEDGRIFLHSVDLLRLHGDEKCEVGRVVSMNYPSLAKYWKLNVEVTSPEIVLNLFKLNHEIISTEPSLAFIDANHMHPWPLI